MQLDAQTQQSKLNASVVSTPLHDLFVAYRGVSEDGAFALDVRINPLISFVWAGFFILMAGTALAFAGRREGAGKVNDADGAQATALSEGEPGQETVSGIASSLDADNKTEVLSSARVSADAEQDAPSALDAAGDSTASSDGERS